MIDIQNIKVDNNQIFKCELLTEKISIPFKYTRKDYKNETFLEENPHFIDSEITLKIIVEYYQRNRKEIKIYSVKFGDREKIYIKEKNSVEIRDIFYYEILNWTTENIIACEKAQTDIGTLYSYLCESFDLIRN